MLGWDFKVGRPPPRFVFTSDVMLQRKVSMLSGEKRERLRSLVVSSFARFLRLDAPLSCFLFAVSCDVAL